MWSEFTWLATQLWFLVQFWVALSLFAKMWMLSLTKFFGPLSVDNHLDLEANREKFIGARIASNALSRGNSSYVWRFIAFIVGVCMRICDAILSVIRGILEVKP